ncbi:hypothetical protein FF38_06085 [Lucilia cuprina]|uniref:Uncharacterized protein n=1 Tax=Lucilia cuprina TaxID=7375 RepID=A0A0L0CI07_LUCCU|nr:hypothetical protein CVS40_10452 [Lucilia cuprina]KNC31852.1 hypothetical protein FF38_06085 [Lucilia cuprina]
MYLKKKCLSGLLVICCIYIFGFSKASACSLDRMREYAKQACEHLFDFDTEVRERRSLDLKKNYDYLPRQPLKHFLNVRRSIYPPGGYLKVAPEHYDKLSILDVSPRYKSKKISHIMNEKKMRNKREGKNYLNHNNNIPYCCFHRCDAEFFCG